VLPPLQRRGDATASHKLLYPGQRFTGRRGSGDDSNGAASGTPCDPSGSEPQIEVAERRFARARSCSARSADVTTSPKSSASTPRHIATGTDLEQPRAACIGEPSSASSAVRATM
jgi:hypothetical protein